MAASDALIGAGAALAGGGLAYIAASRDRRQRARDAGEDRDFASRQEACLLLEAQRVRQLEEADKLLNSRTKGIDFEPREDHSDIQNPRTDAMVSLLLSEAIEAMVERINDLWSAFLSSVRFLDLADKGQPRVDADMEMKEVHGWLKSASEELRQALREEARTRP